MSWSTKLQIVVPSQANPCVVKKKQTSADSFTTDFIHPLKNQAKSGAKIFRFTWRAEQQITDRHLMSYFGIKLMSMISQTDDRKNRYHDQQFALSTLHQFLFP